MADPQPRVAILPYPKRFGWTGTIALTDLLWPLGTPHGIEGQTIADLRPTDHLVALPHLPLFLRPSLGTPAKVSVMFLEPRAVHARYMRLARLFQTRFHRILTGDSALLASAPDAKLFPIGGCWVPHSDKIDLTKTAMCSLIASGKRRQLGHKLRHEVVDWCRATGQDVQIMGRGYTHFAEKSDGLAPYRYSVVIENAQETNYFTEKLIDALLCNTVPIYWGCPNIGDFFDTSGMILCNSKADIQRAIAAMSVEDYASRLPGLAAARKVAPDYGDFYDRAARLLAAG